MRIRDSHCDEYSHNQRSAKVKGMVFCGNIAMMGEVEELTAEGFATGVKLRCEKLVAASVTKWLQGKVTGKGRYCEPHVPKEGPCLMETK